jgi:hypothetical protein
MRRLALIIGALAIAGSAAAQSPRFALRPFAGAYVPTGAHADAFSTAFTAGGEGAYRLTPHFSVVGAFAWINGVDKFAPLDSRAHTYTYDLGLEANAVQPLGGAWSLKPFVGLGAGARSYGYSDPALDNGTFASGYGALGTDVMVGRNALRLQMRDMLSDFRMPTTSTKSTRNDMSFTMGFGFHF